MSTGFRVSELATLTPDSFDLDGEMAAATVPGAYTKNKRLAEQPLPSDVVETLRDYLDGKPAGEPLWPGTWTEKAAKMLRLDLAEATAALKKIDKEAEGIPYVIEGPNGKEYADFHSLRHSYISNLVAAGVNPKVAQDLARHSTVTLTLGRYAHVRLHDKTAAVDNLPALTKPTPDAKRQTAAWKATGTDGDAASRCTARCTNVASTADSERDGLTFVDTRAVGKSVAASADVQRGLIASETNRDGLNRMKALGLEPRTYGLKVCGEGYGT